MKSLHHITVSPATLPIICTYLFAGKVLRCSLTVCVIARNTQELIVEKLISNSNFVTLSLPQIFILFISPAHPSPLDHYCLMTDFANIYPLLSTMNNCEHFFGVIMR